jgi:hypothetical protein
LGAADGVNAHASRGPEIPQRENFGPLEQGTENSVESPGAGLLSNLHTDEPDTSMAGDDAYGVPGTSNDQPKGGA